MSSIYKNLSSEDLKFDKTNSSFNLSDKAAKAPSLAGIKIAIFFSFILSFVGLAGAGYLYQQVNAERRQRQALEASQMQIQEKASAFQQATKKYQEQIAGLTQQVEDVREERENAAKNLAERQTEIDSMKKQIQSLEDRNTMLEADASTFREQLSKVAVPETTEEAADNETGEAAEAAVEEAPASAVNGPAPAPAAAGVKQAVEPAKTEPAPAKKPKILTVNRKFNFVVIGLGIQDGIKMGDTLYIQRAGKTLSTVQVEKLYTNFAAATIVQESKKDQVKEGDDVVRSENQ